MDFKELTHTIKHKFEHLLDKENSHEGETCQDHYLHHEEHEHDHEHSHEHSHGHGHHHGHDHDDVRAHDCVHANVHGRARALHGASNDLGMSLLHESFLYLISAQIYV